MVFFVVVVVVMELWPTSKWICNSTIKFDNSITIMVYVTCLIKINVYIIKIVEKFNILISEMCDSALP